LVRCVLSIIWFGATSDLYIHYWYYIYVNCTLRYLHFHQLSRSSVKWFTIYSIYSIFQLAATATFFRRWHRRVPQNDIYIPFKFGDFRLSGPKVMAIVCSGHNDVAKQPYLPWYKFLSHFSYALSSLYICRWSTAQLSILWIGAVWSTSSHAATKATPHHGDTANVRCRK